MTCNCRRIKSVNEIIFLHQMSLMPHRYDVQRERERERERAGSRSVSWPCSDSKHIFCPARPRPFCSCEISPLPCFHHHAASFSQACFARLMSLLILHLSSRISEAVELCHVSHSATFSFFPLSCCLAGMGWRALPEVSV